MSELDKKSPTAQDIRTKFITPALTAGNISVVNLGNMQVTDPPLAEQQRIVAKVDELMRWGDALEARLTAAQTTAEHLLDAILHQILAA